MELRIRVPRVPSGMAGNLLGLLGLIAVALAVGGLTGNWWWSVLVGGAMAVGLSYIAQTHAVAEAEEAAPPRLVASAKRPPVAAVVSA